MDNCFLEKNQGEVAAAVFFNGNNTLILNNCLVRDNQGFVRGGLFVLSGKNHKLLVNNVSFIGNQAPFKGNLIEISEQNDVRFNGAVVDYDKTGNGNFLFLERANALLVADLLARNITNLDIFLLCNTENSISILNSTVQNNKWTNAFIYSMFDNKISVSNIKISNISITDTASGFLYLLKSTQLSLLNLTFLHLSGESSMIIRADELNTIKIENMSLNYIRVTGAGYCLNLLSSNKVEMRGVEFMNFLGYSNDIFIFKLYKENTLSLSELSISGYFSIEQVWNFTCMIRITGNRNSISITTCTTRSENPSFLKVQSLSFFKIEGQDNSLSISSTSITINKFLSFLESDANSSILLRDCKFKNCDIYGHLITLRNGSSLTCVGSKFHSNKLRREKGLFLLSFNVKALLKMVSCNSNTLFLKSERAHYNITKSSFINLFLDVNQQQGYASPLFINDQNSIAYYEYNEILLRENKEDSIIIVLSSTVKIRFSTFGFNKALFGGCLRLSSGSVLVLDTNTFYGNEALNGGILKFDNISYVSITNNYFFSNIAVNRHNQSGVQGKGGCFYAMISEKQEDFIKFEIKNNRFVLGGAEIGGIIYLHERRSAEYLSTMKFTESNEFKLTKVRFYGTLYASYPREIKMNMGQDLNSRAVDSLKIKEKIPFSTALPSCLFQIVSVDFFNQTTLGESRFQALTLNDNSGFGLDFSIRNSFLCFSAFKPESTSLSKLTNEILHLKINSSSLTANDSTIEEAKILDIEMSIRKCSGGEYFDLQQLKCLACQPNFHSFDSEFIEPSSCKSCLQEPFYCYGGFNLTPKAGYWRRSAQSVNFIKCPVPAACLGDPALDDPSFQMTILSIEYSHSIPVGICGLAYEGILCNKCREGYAKTGGARCSPCGEGLSIFLMILKILLRIFLYYYTIYKAVMMCRKLKNNKLPKDLLYSNFFLKILILHFQFLKTFIGFPFNFPTLLKEAFNIFSFSISSGADKVLNMECFIHISTIPTAYIYCIINIAAPLFVVTSITAFLQDDEKPSQSDDSPSRLMFSSQNSPINTPARMSRSYMTNSRITNFKVRILPYLFVISLMLSYDEVLSYLIHNFSSINVEDEYRPDFRVVNDFEIDFYSAQHQIWIYSFSLPFTLIIGLMLPSFIIFNIFRARRKQQLQAKTTLLRFGYFYFAYEESQYFYELVYFLRKIFLIAMDSFFIKVLTLSSMYNPMTLCIVICFFYTGLSFFSIMNKPYKHSLYPALNRIENISVTVQALTAWIGCLIMSFDDGRSEKAREVVFTIGFIVTLAINLLMFVIWGYFYWKLSIAARIKTAMKSFGNKIHKKSSITPKNLQLQKAKTVIRSVEEHRSLSSIDINGSFKEVEHEVYIPPHASSRWSSKIPPAQEHLRKTNTSINRGEKFVVINTAEVNPSLGLSWMDYLWRRFDESLGKSPEQDFVKILFSKWAFRDKIECAKKLIVNQKKGPFLEIDIRMQIETLQQEEEESLLSKELKAYCSFGNRCALSSSITYEYSSSEQALTFKMSASINNMNQIRLVNCLEIGLISQSLESICLACNVNVFMFDFLEQESSASGDEAFHQLLDQDSRILNLRAPFEGASIQIIKSKDFKIKNKAAYVFYYRELSYENSQPRFNIYIPLVTNYVLY